MRTELGELKLRQAKAEDLAAMIGILTDDPLGKARERPGDPAYMAAFREIEADPNNELWVIEGPDQQGAAAVMGCLQLTFIPGISRIGAMRAQIEGVRIVDRLQGKGVGRWLFESMIERARERGAKMVQLTSDKTRPEAIRFYERLGFEASHEGLKLKLT